MVVKLQVPREAEEAILNEEEVYEALLKEGLRREDLQVHVGWIRNDYVTVTKSVVSNIMPLKHDKEYNNESLNVMYRLRRGMSIDISRLFINQLIAGRTTSLKKESFPFPGLVTSFVQQDRVKLQGFP